VVSEATNGAAVEPGCVLIAPGGYHLRVRRTGPSTVVTVLDREAQENSCRPSVDVLFRSLAESYGGDVLSVMLTGMGRDGLKGVEKLKQQGAAILAQDEATSVVWGMPGAVARAGLVDAILPLDRIPAELMRLIPEVARAR
jgi:two-component system, chemotaxis family, protein-glutamate methylesterase/glutaminase